MEHKCLNDGTVLVKHRNAGKRQYKSYPNLLICPNCWSKYDPQEDGTLVRVKNPSKKGVSR